MNARVAELEALRDQWVPEVRPGWLEWRRRGLSPEELWEWMWLTRSVAAAAA